MYHQRLLSTKFLFTLVAFKISNVVVSLYVIRVVSLRVHRKTTKAALISFDTKMNYVEVIDDMRFVLESETDN